MNNEHDYTELEPDIQWGDVKFNIENKLKELLWDKEYEKNFRKKYGYDEEDQEALDWLRQKGQNESALLKSVLPKRSVETSQLPNPADHQKYMADLGGSPIKPYNIENGFDDYPTGLKDWFMDKPEVSPEYSDLYDYTRKGFYNIPRAVRAGSKEGSIINNADINQSERDLKRLAYPEEYFDPNHPDLLDEMLSPPRKKFQKTKKLFKK